MKPLLPVSLTPEFEEKLLAEINSDTFRAELDELRVAVQSANTRPKKARRHIRPVEPPAERWEEHASLIAKAARKAGTNNGFFCKLLDDLDVRPPRRWHVTSWRAAYNKLGTDKKPRLRASIRRFKSRYKPNPNLSE